MQTKNERLTKQEEIYARAYLNQKLSESWRAGYSWAQIDCSGNQMDASKCQKSAEAFDEVLSFFFDRISISRLDSYTRSLAMFIR